MNPGVMMLKRYKPKLTKMQLYGILENPTKKNLTEIAKEHNIDVGYLWKQIRRSKELTEEIIQAKTIGKAVSNIDTLQEAADNGSVKAAQILLEIAGMYTPASAAQVNINNQQNNIGKVIEVPAKKEIGEPVDCKIIELETRKSG